MNGLEEFIPLFLEEAEEHIHHLEVELPKLENDLENEAALEEIFRAAHSLKSGSASLGFGEMSELAHRMEDLLFKVRKKEIKIDEKMMQLLFQCTDVLKEMYESISETKAIEGHLHPIVEVLIGEIGDYIESATEVQEPIIINLDDEEELGESGKSDTDSKGLMESEPEKRPTEEIQVKKFAFSTATKVDEEKLAKSTRTKSDGSDESGESKKNDRDTKKAKKKKTAHDEKDIKNIQMTTIRVDVEKIDKLLKLVGEFIIDKEMLKQVGRNLREKYKNDRDVRLLLEGVQHISAIGNEIQNTVMKTRMLPLEVIFDRFPKIVRDLSIKLDKKIDFTITGKATEIDRGILENLIDPITHIIRNSIDHGFEAESERIALGKSPAGKLYLNARYEEKHVVIEVEDDGKGIDVEKVKAKAIAKNLISKEWGDTISDNEIIQYVFESGFSTVEEVTDLSGRGVGLDVVKSNINKLNGMIEVKTEAGKGTRLIIRLPLTLAIVQVLLIKEKKFTFGLPISSVVETIRLKGDETKRVHKISNKEVFNWRDQVIPVIRLGKWFGVDHSQKDEKVIIVIVKNSSKNYAFVIDKLMGEQEVVIKSINDYVGENKLFGEMKGVVGVSILGDGCFAQIVDVVAITSLKHS